MYTIGFTSKFYTLWDITIEHFTNNYGRKGECVTAAYIKNISMDEQVARSKYPDAPVNLELRGHSSFKRTTWEPLPSDIFPCGKYMGTPIIECKDWDYLHWAINNILFGESRDIAVDNLLKSGEYGEYNGQIMTAKELEEIEQRDDEQDRIIAEIETTGALNIVSATNLQVWDDFYGDDFLTHYIWGSHSNHAGVRIYWPESMVSVFSYNGYSYGLPVKDGKAKRIKGKSIKLVVDSYTIDQFNYGRFVNINVKDFEIIK